MQINREKVGNWRLPSSPGSAILTDYVKGATGNWILVRGFRTSEGVRVLYGELQVHMWASIGMLAYTPWPYRFRILQKLDFYYPEEGRAFED